MYMGGSAKGGEHLDYQAIGSRFSTSDPSSLHNMHLRLAISERTLRRSGTSPRVSYRKTTGGKTLLHSPLRGASVNYRQT